MKSNIDDWGKRECVWPSRRERMVFIWINKQRKGNTKMICDNRDGENSNNIRRMEAVKNKEKQETSGETTCEEVFFLNISFFFLFPFYHTHYSPLLNSEKKIKKHRIVHALRRRKMQHHNHYHHNSREHQEWNHSPFSCTFFLFFLHKVKVIIQPSFNPTTLVYFLNLSLGHNCVVSFFSLLLLSDNSMEEMLSKVQPGEEVDFFFWKWWSPCFPIPP